MNATGHGFAGWYRQQYSLEPLRLDSQDYVAQGKAPLTFNVINTTNLVDHLGAINILVAASPLLDGSLSATLYMESLVRQEKDQQALIERLVCGHFPSVSILLGLFPIGYWTNATATSTAEEVLLDTTRSHEGASSKPHGTQVYTKISWKRPVSAPVGKAPIVSTPSVKFDETELARMLFSIYVNMFQHEDMSRMFSHLDILTVQNNSRPLYNRGLLAIFLSFVKRRAVVSDWEKVMDAFLDLVQNDRSILMGGNYIQELYLQLHVLDVYSAPTFRPPFIVRHPSSSWKGLSGWKNIPAAVCITLKIPRTVLRVFTDHSSAAVATPLLECLLQSSETSLAGGWQNIFAAAQLAFGDLNTSGSRDDGNFFIEVTEDRHRWKGSSPLLVSFYAPSWILLLEAQATIVGLGIQSMPLSTQTFLETLGLDLNVYKTTLGDEDHVFITRHPPNQAGFPSVCSLLFGHLRQST